LFLSSKRRGNFSRFFYDVGKWILRSCIPTLRHHTSAVAAEVSGVSLGYYTPPPFTPVKTRGVFELRDQLEKLGLFRAQMRFNTPAFWFFGLKPVCSYGEIPTLKVGFIAICTRLIELEYQP
jgi:hypothetical protein